MTPPEDGDLSFRRASMEDATAVAALVREAYQHYVPRLGAAPGPMVADYPEVLRQRDVDVVESAGHIVGLLVMHVTSDDCVIENVAVSPRHQGRGLGSAMLERAEARAQRSGHTVIRLYTHEKMTENRRFYRSRGYVEYQPARRAEDELVHFRKHVHDRAS
ncbi:MAG: GNAT family N-acetyltransferase [Acidimicrobiales bacterium]